MRLVGPSQGALAAESARRAAAKYRFVPEHELAELRAAIEAGDDERWRVLERRAQARALYREAASCFWSDPRLDSPCPVPGGCAVALLDSDDFYDLDDDRRIEQGIAYEIDVASGETSVRRWRSTTLLLYFAGELHRGEIDVDLLPAALKGWRRAKEAEAAARSERAVSVKAPDDEEAVSSGGSGLPVMSAAPASSSQVEAPAEPTEEPVFSRPGGVIADDAGEGRDRRAWRKKSGGDSLLDRVF